MTGLIKHHPSSVGDVPSSGWSVFTIHVLRLTSFRGGAENDDEALLPGGKA